MDNEKAKSVLAYIFGFIGGIIILLVKGTEKRTRIHAAQSITISIFYFLLNVAYGFLPINIPYFQLAIYGVYLAATILGIIKVCKNEEPELPIIGDLAKNIFGKQIEG